MQKRTGKVKLVTSSSRWLGQAPGPESCPARYGAGGSSLGTSGRVTSTASQHSAASA
jgi:hypothetical protein